MLPACRGFKKHLMPCRTPIGAMGFPSAGVAAFDPDEGGVISAGGVGFDISCGVRTLCTGLTRDDVESVKQQLAGELSRQIPAGVGSRGKISLNPREMDEMLFGGARWAVAKGYGTRQDLELIEENGCMAGADPEEVSPQAKKRQKNEMGNPRIGQPLPGGSGSRKGF